MDARFSCRTLILLTLAGLVAGCAQHGLDGGRGGLDPEQSARLSLALAQVRAQTPADRVSGLPYESRSDPEGLRDPELALTGEGMGLSRGFQTGQKSKVRLALYLDKSSYMRGHAKVSRDGGAEEVWRIVAYDLRGDADKDFQFTYLLADPAGALRTLMLLGGTYQDGKADLTAIEGTLLLPDPAPRAKRFTPEEWQTAFPFAFVLKEPAVPAYQSLTAQAEDLFRDLDREVPDLERLAQRIDSLPAEAPAPEEAPVSAADGATASPAPRSSDDRAAALRAGLEKQLKQRAALAQAKAVHYYQLRAEADTTFTAYLATNRYTWRNADGQQGAFTRWAEPGRNEDAVEDRIAHLLPFVPEPQKLEDARKAAFDTIAKNKNAARRPVLPAKN
jgi:hypothetical protein